MQMSHHINDLKCGSWSIPNDLQKKADHTKIGRVSHPYCMRSSKHRCVQ